MLQQTTTARVERKYKEFLRAFPDLESLSGSPLRDVLGAWQGLGYNRRAESLWRSAKIISTDFGGAIPRSPQKLQGLPGIGAATAAAVAVFAFNEPHPFIETNIRRVFLHFYFPEAAHVFDREILPLVEKTMDRHDPREWFFALTDYGAMLKKGPSNPNVRSAHYRRQSPFEGSTRQIRGKILRALLKARVASLDELARSTGSAPSTLTPILAALAKERLLSRKGARFSLP